MRARAKPMSLETALERPPEWGADLPVTLGVNAGESSLVANAFSKTLDAPGMRRRLSSRTSESPSLCRSLTNAP
jgi:hypothetical protein